MENKYQNEERYFKAKKQVEEIKGFYGNLTAYIVINIFFLILNLRTSPEHLWFFWPMLGWGIGVIFHGFKAFNYTPFLGKNWEDRKIKEFMNEDKEPKDSWR